MKQAEILADLTSHYGLSATNAPARRLTIEALAGHVSAGFGTSEATNHAAAASPATTVASADLAEPVKEAPLASPPQPGRHRRADPSAVLPALLELVAEKIDTTKNSKQTSNSRPTWGSTPSTSRSWRTSPSATVCPR